MCFVLVAGLGSLFTAWVLPPFMAPDEVAQTYRANLLTWGRLIAEPTSVDGLAGGPGDTVLRRVAAPFESIKFHPERRADPQAIHSVAALGWEGGQPTVFSNTATYAPFLYLPQTEAFAAAKVLRLPVVFSLSLARTANALACVFVGTLALLTVAGRLRWAMTAVLGLPMSIFLYGTITQDGMILVFTALGVAIVSRAMEADHPLSTKALWQAALCFTLVGLGKPPYSLFGLCLAAAPSRDPRQRLAAAALAPLASLGWSTAMHFAGRVGGPAEYATDIAGQIQFLLHHPLAWIKVAIVTLRDNGLQYLRELVGILGWIDVFLPSAFYFLAWGVLILVFAAAAGPNPRTGWRWMRGCTWTASAAAAAVLFGVFYVLWTAVAAPRVEGVQGRYLIPLALFIPLGLAGSGPAPTGGRVRQMLVRICPAACGLLLLSGLWVMVQAIQRRYYG